MPAISLEHLGPLYHDYALFGASNTQIGGAFAANQRCKEPTITAYIRTALEESRRQRSESVSFAELFCADGFYAMYARKLGADSCLGIDNNREGHFHTGPKIAAALGLSSIQFIEADISEIEKFGQVDIVANLGGLYHVPDPETVLRQSFQMARRFLIVQSVYSLAEESPQYFESPAPGWDWGCRFSLAWLRNRVESLGGQLLAQSHNELEGNSRPEDRGSAYFLLSR